MLILVGAITGGLLIGFIYWVYKAGEAAGKTNQKKDGSSES